MKKLKRYIKRTNQFVKRDYREHPEYKEKSFFWKVRHWLNWYSVVEMFGGASYFEF